MSILTIIVFIISIKFSVTTLVSIKEDDLVEWPPGSLTYFNSLYAVTIDEEYLNIRKWCSGNCDRLSRSQKNLTKSLSYPNTCHGTIQYCWFHKKTEKRQQAKHDFSQISDLIQEYRMTRGLQKRLNNAYYKYHHTGNICKCLCERTYDPKDPTFRGILRDSICFDPVSVDTGNVATGARFRIIENRIHLELQQGILINGTIDPRTVTWKEAAGCKNSKKVVYGFKNGKYKGLKITLEDIVLPIGVAVTGMDTDRRI